MTHLCIADSYLYGVRRASSHPLSPSASRPLSPSAPQPHNFTTIPALSHSASQPQIPVSVAGVDVLHLMTLARSKPGKLSKILLSRVRVQVQGALPRMCIGRRHRPRLRYISLARQVISTYYVHLNWRLDIRVKTPTSVYRQLQFAFYSRQAPYPTYCTHPPLTETVASP